MWDQEHPIAKRYSKNIYLFLSLIVASPPMPALQFSISLILPNFSLKVLAIPLPSLQSLLIQCARLELEGQVNKSPTCSVSWKLGLWRFSSISPESSSFLFLEFSPFSKLYKERLHSSVKVFLSNARFNHFNYTLYWKLYKS